jgi:hypothetical protein
MGTTYEQWLGHFATGQALYSEILIVADRPIGTFANGQHIAELPVPGHKKLFGRFF